MDTQQSFTTLELLLFAILALMLIVNFILSYQFRTMRKIANELGDLVAKKQYTIEIMRIELKEYFDRDNKKKRDRSGRFEPKNN